MSRHFVDSVKEYISYGDVTEIENVQNMTMSAWIKRDTSTSAVHVSSYNDTSNMMAIAAYSNGRLYLSCSNGSNTYVNVLNNSTLWQHIVYVYDGSQAVANDRVKLYINGVLQSPTHTGTHPTSTASDLGTFQIGVRIGASTAERTDGQIAEVKVWNSSLTDEQAMQDCFGPIPAMENLILYVPLGRSVENDISGSGYLGTIYESPTIDDHSPNGPAYPLGRYTKHIVPVVGVGGLLMHPSMDGLGGRYFNSTMNGGING